MKQILVSARAFNMALILVKGAYAWPESHTELTQAIDVWWVVHDGGLLLLLSIILRKHRTWHRAPLRVFCVCHADDDPLALHASIKSFLYEMRISAKLQARVHVHIRTRGRLMPHARQAVPVCRCHALGERDISRGRALRHPLLLHCGGTTTILRSLPVAAPPLSLARSPCGWQVVQISEGAGLDALLPTRGANWDGAKPRYNKAIIARPLGTLHFGSTPSSQSEEARQDEEAQQGQQDDDEEVIREVMTEQDIAATAELEPKMRTTLAFNHVMRKHSHNSALVMTNLPVPRDEDQTTQAYMEHLAVLMNNIPRALLVAGQKDADVITMYS